MKLNIILAIVVAILGWATCKNLKKNQETEPLSTAVDPSSKGPVGWNASRIVEGHNPDTAGTYQVREAPRYVEVPIDALPPASASRKAYLSSGYWHLNMAFQPSDTLVHENYQHKWLKFREDQTFDVLIKGKPVESGRWNWDEAKHEIYLSCKDTYINNTWVVKESGFVMIWKGNTALNVTGIQVRVVGSGTLPASEE